MKSLSIKRISLIVLCGILLFGALIFAGCNSSGNKSYEEQGYTAVREVRYYYPGTYSSHEGISEFTSYFTVDFSTIQEISAEEFNNLNYSIFSGNISNDMDNVNKVYYSTNEIYKYATYDSYYLIEITEITEYYVYTKILDENRFELIDTTGRHYLINTTYYSIEYFV